jgi:hypothetical protein
VANLVTVRCTAVEPTASFDSPGAMSAPAKGQLAQFKEDPKVGDFAAAFNAADVKIDAAYETPPQHHNPDGAVCDQLRKDAGSGPTPGATGQTITTGSADTKEHPPTETMNRVAVAKAMSSEDAQRQQQGQPTAAQEAQGAKPSAKIAEQGCSRLLMRSGSSYADESRPPCPIVLAP